MTRDDSPDARGWRRQADALAAWADTYLVTRRDVWGCYIAPERRTEGGQSTYTAPPLTRRGQDLLTRAVLARHFQGGHVIGLHSTAPDHTSRWGAFDVDVHDEATADAARETLRRLAPTLRRRGAEPIIEDACGRGGAHVWVVLSSPVPTRDVFAFLVDVLREAGVTAETFPKQAKLSGGGFGNWLRLPGRHHTRAHWSRIAAGGKWRRGADAARALLEHPITAASLIPAAPPEPAPTLSWRSRNVSLRPADRDDRISRYLAKLPVGLRAGDGRSDVAFSFARFLVVKVGTSDAEALDWLHEWNRRNGTALPDAKLATTLANVRRYCLGAAA